MVRTAIERELQNETRERMRLEKEVTRLQYEVEDLRGLTRMQTAALASQIRFMNEAMTMGQAIVRGILSTSTDGDK